MAARPSSGSRAPCQTVSWPKPIVTGSWLAPRPLTATATASGARWSRKMYLFLRDFMPQGITAGRPILPHLWERRDGPAALPFSHLSESTPSRHKVTKYAEATFTDLNHWMGTFKTWQAAFENAKEAEAEEEQEHQEVTRGEGAWT